MCACACACACARARACACVTPLDARFGNLFSKRELMMWWKTSLVDKLIGNCREMYQKN